MPAVVELLLLTHYTCIGLTDLINRVKPGFCPWWIAVCEPGEPGEVMERNSFGNVPPNMRGDLMKWKLEKQVREQQDEMVELTKSGLELVDELEQAKEQKRQAEERADAFAGDCAELLAQLPHQPGVVHVLVDRALVAGVEEDRARRAVGRVEGAVGRRFPPLGVEADALRDGHAMGKRQKKPISICQKKPIATSATCPYSSACVVHVSAGA